MKEEQVNVAIANAIGLKVKKILYTKVMRNTDTGEFRIFIEVIATEKQIIKIKEILIKNLQGE